MDDSPPTRLLEQINSDGLVAVEWLPNKVRLGKLFWSVVMRFEIDEWIAATRDDIKRWSHRSNAADKRRLAEYIPPLNAQVARLAERDGFAADARQRVTARYDSEDLFQAWQAKRREHERLSST